MSGEPNFSVDFTARVLGTEGPVAVGDALVYDPTYVVNGVAGIWRIASSSNRSAAGGAGADAIALTAYGGSVIGSVSYQASGVLPAEISGLPALAPSSTNKLVRTSTTGRLERIDSYTAGDDVIGYARWNGRVALHIGLPWDMIAAIAGGGGATPAGVTGDIQVKQDATTFNVVGFWTAQDNAGTLRATYWDPVDGVTLRSCIEVSGGGAPFWPSEQYPSYGLFRLADSFHSTGGWSFLTVHDGSNTRGLLGLSLGNYFVGDSTGNIPTTIYGYSVQIVAGAGGASVQGGLAAGSLTLTTALSAANGGTGLTAPGTSGNVLTSNGSAWVSSAPAAGLTLAGSSGQIQNNNGAGNLGAPGPYMGAAYVSIISGTPTNSGFRMGNTHRVAGRKSDGSADLDLCQLDASDVAIIGSLSANTSVRALGTLTLATNSGSTTAILTSSKFSVNVPIELGTGTLATAGLIRTQEGPAEPFWKAGAKVYIDAQVNEMTIGCDKSYANATSNVRIYPSALAVMGIAGNNYVACATGGTITLSQTTQLGATVSVGGGVRVLGIANATTDPTSNPTAGGILYVSSGALKYRGSGGTTTPVAPAEPHCPKCGTDVGIMGAENELFGEEILICRMCEARTGNGVVMTIANFFEYRKAA